MAGTRCHFHPSCLHLKAGLKAVTESGRRENGFGNYLCYWQGKKDCANLPGQQLVAERSDNTEVLSVPAAGYSPFLHKFPLINSGQDFLQFSSKPCTDISIFQ